MASNHFALLMVARVMLLTVALTGLSISIIAEGYYATTFLLFEVTVILLFELYHYVSKTNTELVRFLDAARYEDFSQRFQPMNTGAGFELLSQKFDNIMQSFKTARQQQEEKLRHLKSLTEHMPLPLMSLHPDGRIQLHNNAARHLFGNIVVNKLKDLNSFSNDFFDAIKNLEPGDRKLVRFSYDGMQQQLTVMATQITTGTISETLISMQDIQSELDVAQLQAWQDLVRVLTHEIMNSITPVISLAKTATDLVDDVCIKLNEKTSTKVLLKEFEDIRNAVDTVARRSDGLMHFVQGYRSLTELPTPKKQNLLLADLFQRVQALFASHWAAKGIDLSINIVPKNLPLFADQDLLEQLLINLLQNAEYALSSTDHPKISITARLNQRGHVTIEVADNGIGIPSGIINEIFMPYFTTKPQGFGIGLALTRQTMIVHGGSVSVSTSDMGGAKFTLIFL